MARLLRKLRGALRDPFRAFRILYREGKHKLLIRFWYSRTPTCTFTLPGGEKISFLTGDWYSKEWFFPRCDHGRFHEPAVTQALIALIDETTPSFIDVGAHLGYFSVVAGRLLKGRPVIAYEMDDRPFERLSKNLSHNKLEGATAIHAAIAAATGPVAYRRLAMLDSGESLSFEGSDDPAAVVDGFSLDDALHAQNVSPGIIKIDVEGAELEVLKGMSKTLAVHPVLFLEIHGSKLKSFGTDSQAVLRFLYEKGYEAFEFENHRGNSPVVRLLSSDTAPFARNTMCIVVHVSVRDAVLAKLARVGTTQTHFNEAATGQAYGSYEERRWGANDRVKAQQEQATSFLSHRVLNLLPTTGIVMELGPGPGTWTRLIAEHAPKVKFILIDIAKEMLERAQQAIGEERVLEAIETDFTYAAPAPASVDFFFSSRAIEYVPDKYKGVQTIATALKKGGAGCVITKMPKPLMNRLSGREQSTLHSGQISPRSLRSAFVAAGLTITHIYPVTFAVPLLRSAVLDRVVGKVFSAVPLNPFSALFAESYAVIFHKP